MKTTRLATWLPLWAAAALIVGCSDDDAPAVPGTTTLSGTAAIGAPLVNANISLNCNGTTTSGGTTGTAGNWSRSVPTSTLPCIVRVNGGTIGSSTGPSNPLTLYSLTSVGGATTANVTPLTSLALARASQAASGVSNLATLFGTSQSTSSLAALLATTTASVTALQTGMTARGYNWPGSSFNPFSTPFTATAGNPYDDLIEELMTSVGTADPATALDTLASSFASGGALPTAPVVDPELPSNLAVLTAYAGTYTVTGTATGDDALRGTATRDHARGTITIAANGNVDYDTGISFTGAQIGAIYDRSTVAHDRRIVVNYDADDSGRSLRIYLDADLSVVEIIYRDGAGAITRAAVGSNRADGAIGSATFNGAFGGTADTFVAAAIGTHDVAIYRAPAGSESHIGPGKFIVSGTGSAWEMRLETNDGTVISSTQNTVSFFATANPAIGYLFINNGSGTATFMGATLKEDGSIDGYTGGFSEYGFRNNVAAYGSTVPALFGQLAGTWSGESVANTCIVDGMKPTITVTIAANGSVTNLGKGNLSCTVTEIASIWNGNDDYVAAAPADAGGGYYIQIDSIKGGGSQSQGGIRIQIPSLDAPNSIMHVRSGLSGASGNIETANPTKQ